ncbi:MAG: lipopolysaccharide biosynthesis protein [Chryseolinea sp.]
MISKRFLKSSLIYTIAGILPMASALILFPLYVYHLSLDVYGALSIYLAFITLVQILITFSFDTSVYVHYHEYKNDSEKLADFISSAFAFMLLSGVVVATLLSLAGELIFRVALPGQNISFFPYGLASVGTGVFLAVFKVHSSLLQTREKPEMFLWSNVLVLSLIVVFTVIGMRWHPHSLAGPVYGRLLGAFIPFLWVLWRIFKEFGLRFNFHWLRGSLAFNIYAFIYQLQQWFINQFDRVVMLLYLTLADVGVYDVALKCLLPIELLMNSLQSAFYPRVVSQLMGKTDQRGAEEVNRYYHGLIAVVMLLVTGSILAFPIAIKVFVLKLFSNKAAYADAVQYIPYIAVIYLFKVIRMYFAIPYNTLKYTRPLPVIYMIVVAVKIVLMIVLMQKMQIYGAVAASLASAAVEVYLMKRFMKGRFIYRYNVYKVVVAPTMLLLLIIAVEPLVPGDWKWLAHTIYFILCFGLLLWTYRNELKWVNPFGQKKE